jgi:hypothetical protein
MPAEPVAVTLTVTQALETLGVPYAIGGSLASALHGVMRATMDADLVADLQTEHAELLVRALGDAFYTDMEMIGHAIRRHSSFNLIHLETMFKVVRSKALLGYRQTQNANGVVFLLLAS